MGKRGPHPGYRMEILRIERSSGMADEDLAFLVSGLRRVCGSLLTVEEGPEFELRQEDFDFGRRQYHASHVLGRLSAGGERSGLTLFVLEGDLFVPGLNFVFGEADPAQGCALVSLHRLHPAHPGGRAGNELFERRALVEAVHETGHLLLLTHCSDPACVMHFSDTLADTDRKGPDFCAACRRRLR